ncbi:hypothetical protein HYW41_05120 [Candidatus Daviesbacteria bacterium]|nr:hypothetical protein [Candidatus Daviesbacteria bacterium]
MSEEREGEGKSHQELSEGDRRKARVVAGEIKTEINRLLGEGDGGIWKIGSSTMVITTNERIPPGSAFKDADFTAEVWTSREIRPGVSGSQQELYAFFSDHNVLKTSIDIAAPLNDLLDLLQLVRQIP